MDAQHLERKSRRPAAIMALIASVVAALLLAVGCGESAAASQPAASGGDSQLVP